MNTSRPPLIAALLRHLGSTCRNDEILGDLAEQYASGRSRSWYWRQVLSAIVIGTLSETWDNRFRALAALAVGWGLLHIGMTFGVWRIWNFGAYQFVVRHITAQPMLRWYTPAIIHLATTTLMLPIYAGAGFAVSRISRTHSAIVLTFAATCAFLRFGSFWSIAYESLMAMDARYIAVFLSHAFADLLVGCTVLFAGGRLSAFSQRGAQ